MGNLTYPKMQLSSKVAEIPEALSIYINQIVYTLRRKGIDVTALSLGEAFFDIPLFDFEKLNVEVCNHYSESRGIVELRKKICEFYENHYNAFVNYENEILISAGSKPIIYMAMQAVLNSNDEVLIHEPAWVSYQEQIKLVGAVPKFIPYSKSVNDIDQFITENTRMIIINNPNNPAGWTYSNEELQFLYNYCRPKGIYILVDEAYSDFIVEEKFCSMASVVPSKDGVIIVNSLSKNMGISGWRIGYVISTPDVIQYILKLNQHLITCAPTILLHYLAKYFDEIIEITLPQAHQVVKKRSEIAAYMDRIGLKYLKGSATFYFFLDIESFVGTSLEFSLYLLFKYGIATVPGISYGKSTERFIRVSIGTESEERIHQALDIIRMVIDSGSIDEKFLEREMNYYGIERFEEKKS